MRNTKNLSTPRQRLLTKVAELLDEYELESMLGSDVHTYIKFFDGLEFAYNGERMVRVSEESKTTAISEPSDS